MTRAPSGSQRIEEWLGPAGEAYSIIKPIVEFLSNPLDEVTGDPDQLREKAQAWRDAADQVEKLATDELSARTDLLSYWEGDAATAFNTELAQVNQSLTEIAQHFDVTAQLLDGSAEGARQAQHLVEQIVKELIAWLMRKVSEFLLKMSKFAKAYKLTSIGQTGVRNWATARYATASGYQLLATNWVIKKTIVQPTLGPAIDNVTGAGETWNLPQVL